MIQSVDSFETAQQISRRSGEQGITTDILLEVNIGEDENKFGYSADEVADQLGKIAELQFVKVKGMMTVAPNFKDSVKISAFLIICTNCLLTSAPKNG